jgi:very-short-patch-repair endonuclease
MPITQELLDRNRRELLDLSTRNRLLSIPVNAKSARVIHIRDELSAEVFRLLVADKKALSFLPGRKIAAPAATENTPRTVAADEDDAAEVGLPQPDDEIDPARGVARRHVDSRLQTTLTSEGLQARLLALHRDAQTMIEEQGVNILYLALGQLQWFEAEAPETPRFAPLILVPVELVRSSASERFQLRARDEEVQENLSLAAKLETDFGLKLPPFPSDEDFDPADYLRAVAASVQSLPHWAVLPDAMTLGFFSFAKFLMYRDLDAANWPAAEELLGHTGVAALLQDGFASEEPAFAEDAHLDELIPVEQLDHVVDADGSQTVAIEWVRRGRSVVIQGPPGTGKSQSITNIIATAVLDGKRVLFVAEKLAALEVVKRRLEREGLGAICLELHSNKANKRAVIDEIGRSWRLGRPKSAELEAIVPRLTAQRDALNLHAASLHTPLAPSGFTPYSLLGRLAMLGDRGREAAELSFADAERWTAAEHNARRALIAELAERIAQMGSPQTHAWRGVRRETVLKIDFDGILARIRAAHDRVATARQTATTLAALVRNTAPATLEEAARVQRLAEHAGKAPPLDKQALCNGIWSAGVEGLRELLAHGRAFALAAAAVGDRVIVEAWTQDFSAVRQAIAAHGESFFRFLSGDYRRAIAAVRGVMSAPLPKPHAERLALVDQLLAGQRARRAILAADASGRAAFGSVWKQEHTDWNQVAAITDWIGTQHAAGLDDSFREVFATIANPAEAARLAATLATDLAAARDAIGAVAAELKLDFTGAFGVAGAASVSFDDWHARSALWLERIEELTRWTNYFTRAEQARALALAPLVALLEEGAVSPARGADAFDRVYFGQLLRAAVRERPELAQFDGELHSRRVADFQQLDRDRLALAKFRVLAAHHTRLPPSTGIGASGIVRGEMERKRGHRSVRRLLKDAGSVVQAIKPVFMMSPLSVAQFLEPGAVEFDLLVIDEASQVQPVDALGAIARCKQIVVVGDSRQLPPTRFFSRITSDAPDAENDEAESAQARDVESILGLCRARGLPERMLRWHYRSRHHSLIAVSNREFYENRLFIVPSPWSAAAGLGLQFHPVTDGVFDRGGTSVNRVEAKAVCRAVIAHARQSPQLSLGVAAFGLKQQQAILDELELLRRENPDTETFFNAHPTEPFFVKNLENVQGDERDVIFISVGYGRDRSGHLAMAFGPLGAEGGERRLNVLISRAKRRCEVFSSIVADDIDLERAKGRGVQALKTFLAFAQTGRLALAERSGGDEPSPLEESVRRALESLGHEVHPQVGLAGFFIDLAVVDRAQGGRYVLGIECDGASYRSSRSARDRDRLRQAVLEDHGWILHRVWSTDWFQRPTEQLNQLVRAIGQARAALAERAKEPPPEVSMQLVVETAAPAGVERETVLELPAKAPVALARPYAVAQFEVPRLIEPHELSTRGLADVLLKIVTVEGPIHEDELAARVRDLWGLQRAGSRIQDAVAAAVRSLLVRKLCAREEDCLFLPEAPVPVRDRSATESSGLRKPDLLPPLEVRAAILAIVETCHGAAKTELPTAVARTLGFKATGATLRALVDAQARKLIRLGALEEDGGLLRLAAKTG